VSFDNDNTSETQLLPVPQYYRIADIAGRLSLSAKTIIRRLADDPGVLIMSEKRRGIRRYQTYLADFANLIWPTSLI